MKKKSTGDSNVIGTPIPALRATDVPVQVGRAGVKRRTIDVAGICAGAVLFVCFAVVIWQNVCDRNGLLFSPVYVGETVLLYARFFWQTIGKGIAHVAAFADWLDLASVWRSAVKVAFVAGEIAMSWTYLSTGYFWVANTCYDYPGVVYAGSAVLVAVFFALMYYFGVFSWVARVSMQSDRAITITSGVCIAGLMGLIGLLGFSHYNNPVSL